VGAAHTLLAHLTHADSLSTAAAAVGAAHTLLAHLTHAGSLSTAAAQQVRALRGAEGARERVRGGA
jgi:hypothetical protein